MNNNHKGPHCAGSCEGQAYSLRIKNLESENQRLRDALDTIARLQLLGYITLGDTISTKMIDALAKTPVDQS